MFGSKKDKSSSSVKEAKKEAKKEEAKGEKRVSHVEKEVRVLEILCELNIFIFYSSM